MPKLIKHTSGSHIGYEFNKMLVGTSFMNITDFVVYAQISDLIEIFISRLYEIQTDFKKVK